MAAPKELRIGYQAIPNGDLVVKNQKLLEKALPDTTIKWVQFDSGGDVNTAIVAGSIDIGLAGQQPRDQGPLGAAEHPLLGAVDPRRHRRRRVTGRAQQRPASLT